MRAFEAASLETATPMDAKRGFVNEAILGAALAACQRAGRGRAAQWLLHEAWQAALVLDPAMCTSVVAAFEASNAFAPTNRILAADLLEHVQRLARAELLETGGSGFA